MTKRPKMLFVSLDVPARTGSGAVVRTFHFLRKMSVECELDLLILQPLSSTDLESVRPLCSRLILPHAAASGKRPIWPQVAKCFVNPFDAWLMPLADCLRRLEWSLEHGKSHRLTNVLIRCAHWLLSLLLAVGKMLRLDAPAICKDHFVALAACEALLAARSSSQKNTYEFLWFEHTVSFPIIERLSKSVECSRYICNSHNVEHILAKQLIGTEATTDVNACSTKRAEARCLESADLVFTCSEDDKLEFRKLRPKGELIVAPNGVELQYFSQSIPRCDDGFTLIFTAAMTYPPNLEAVSYLVNDILPIIQAQEPRVRLIIAGRSADVAAKFSSPAVEIVANPEDIRVHFRRATLAVVPLKTGGGTRLKILEAMAMGIPVVSTSVGAAGVGYRTGQDLEIADSPLRFAETVLDLLRNPEHQRRLSIAGRSFVERGFNWDAITSAAWNHLAERFGKRV